MPQFIEQLIQEHKTLFIALDNLKTLEIGSHEWKDSLFICKNILLTHLKKEDEQLYPKLNKIAETNKSLKTTLDVFAYDMEEISKNALNFFKKYFNTEEFSDFENDLNALQSNLYTRIRKEESVIFPKYKKIIIG